MMFRSMWQRAAATIAALAACLAALSFPTDARADAAGRELVAQAAQALGAPEARRRAAAFAAEHRGTSYALEQAREPTAAIAAARRVYRWHFDAAADRLLQEAEQHFPGGIFFWTRTALTPAGGWRADVMKWRSGTDLQSVSAAEAPRFRLQWERMFAHLLIRQAETAGEPVAAGPNAFRYQDAGGATIEVTLDPATRLPAAAIEVATPRTQPDLVYGEYRRRHNIMFAHRVQAKQGSRVAEDLQLAATRLAAPTAAAFAAPPGYVPAPAAGEPTLRELAPGVLFFDNMPFGNHSMAVDMGDHLVLIEAPSSPEAAATQRRLLEAARPGKPVRHVLVTHHHGDHNGGLRPWVDAGATIVLPAGARVAIERQLRTRGYQGEIRIEEVADRRSFGTGANRIDTYAFASSHAAAHMLMHLPERRILFQGDLFYLPERGDPPPAFPVVRELEALIARHALPVDLIVGVHGRPGTADEFRESLRRGPAPGGRPAASRSGRGATHGRQAAD